MKSLLLSLAIILVVSREGLASSPVTKNVSSLKFDNFLVHEGVNDAIIKLPPYSVVRFQVPSDFKKKSAKILFWTPAYTHLSSWSWWFHPKYMNESCPQLKCTFTTDKKQLNSSDAIMFMSFRNDLITKKDYQNFSAQFPPYRLPHQRWVFYTSESPDLVGDNRERLNGLFNWTMTYRRDSDVFAHYGKVVLTALPSPDLIAKSMRKNYARGKQKMVAWFVSHCGTDSHREVFVRELQKYIPVDIYGKCGNLSCEPHQGSKCYEKLKKEYKFYLSFENSICKDYVTEKFFTALVSDVVPVVFGGANYSLYAPKGSYINALEFESPKALAEYLLFLNKNVVEYNKYFDWKRGYTPSVIRRHHFFSCELCVKLMDRKLPAKVYNNMDDWWVKQGQCRKWHVKK